MVGEGLVWIEVGGDLGLLGLVDLFLGGRAHVIGFGEAVSVAVDGDAGLEDLDGAVDFASADFGRGEEEQAQFSDVGEPAFVMGVVEIGELDQMGGDLVGGEFGDDVVTELLEVVEVSVDGGDGAAHALADLSVGESLLSEGVGFEHLGSSGLVGVVGEWHGLSS